MEIKSKLNLHKRSGDPPPLLDFYCYYLYFWMPSLGLVVLLSLICISPIPCRNFVFLLMTGKTFLSISGAAPESGFLVQQDSSHSNQDSHFLLQQTEDQYFAEDSGIGDTSSNSFLIPISPVFDECSYMLSLDDSETIGDLFDLPRDGMKAESPPIHTSGTCQWFHDTCGIVGVWDY